MKTHDFPEFAKSTMSPLRAGLVGCAIAIAGCTPFTPIAIEAANQPTAQGATTWQAEVPLLARNCVIQTQGGFVDPSTMTGAFYQVKTRPIGANETFYQKTITTSGLFGEFINAEFKNRDDLFENRCSLSLSLTSVNPTSATAEFDKALNANGYSRQSQINPTSSIYSNGAHSIVMQVTQFGDGADISIRENR